MTITDILGFAASAAVLATFCMRSMVALRLVALASNVLFISYAFLNHVHPVLLLHIVLFPINLIWLIRLTSGPGSVTQADAASATADQAAT